MGLTIDQFRWIGRLFSLEATMQEAINSGARAESARFAGHVLQENWEAEDSVD